MKAPLSHTIQGHNFWLSEQRALFWEAEKALIVSDLHLGKSGHFRKAGIAVPQAVLKKDMQRLMDLLHFFKPMQLIVVGDFFHSRMNKELDFFKRWRMDMGNLHIKLVKGNHDILSADWYAETGVEVLNNELSIGNFRFTHDQNSNETALYTFSGHIHPGVQINGLGKQLLRFPCFYFTPTYCILPAFGTFTGSVAVHPKQEDNVYAIVENALIKFQ